MSDKIRILCIAGPTASGKSAAAMECAGALDGEIVSSDSMQLYRGMDIGTAKPTAAERAEIPHHMIDVCDIGEPYSLSDYVEAAAPAVRGIAARGRVPIVCGGTGLYMDTLVAGLELSAAGSDENIRRELYGYAEEHGVQALHKLLADADPESAAAIHPNNIRRVVRALEIYRTTGITKTEWDRQSVRESEFDACVCVIDFADRSELYERIDRRVGIMLEQGLEREVRAIYDAGLLDPDSVAGQAIGYKEFIPYFRGEAGIGEVADAIRQATRRYAKRQETWFRRNSGAHRIAGGDGAAQEILRVWREFARGGNI